MRDSKSSVYSSEPHGGARPQEPAIDSAVHLFEHLAESFVYTGLFQQMARRLAWSESQGIKLIKNAYPQEPRPRDIRSNIPFR